VWGWSDPEHAYTNATTHVGGAVFCTFSTPNLAFWAALGTARGTSGLPAKQNEPQHALDPNAVYIVRVCLGGTCPAVLPHRVLHVLFVGAAAVVGGRGLRCSVVVRATRL
jgi:hypothetical protein